MKFLLASWLLAALACAQGISVSGNVMDHEDVMVAKAELSLKNVQSGVTLKAVSNDAGVFTFAGLTAGRYELAVSAKGFKPYSRHDVEIPDGGISSMEVRLSSAEEVTDEALKQLQSQAAAKPDDCPAQYNLGRAYMEKGDINQASRQLQAALKLDLTYLPALLGLGQMALRINLPTTALSYAEAILRLREGDVSATMITAAADVRAAKAEEALNLLQSLLKINPNDSDVLLEVGAILLQSKKYPEAEKAFGRAYALDPSNLRGLTGLTDVQLALKQPEKALELVTREQAKDAKRIDLREELAAVEFRAGQYDKALAAYQALQENFKDSPTRLAGLFSRIAMVYGKQGDSAHEIESLKKAVQLAPETASYQIGLGAAYERADKPEDALKAYSQALKLEPNNPYILNNAAYLMALKGNDADVDEALRLVQMARRELPDAPAVNDTLGVIYLKKDMVDSAGQIFQDLLAKDASNPSYHYHYAMVLAKKGEHAAALEQLHLAVENKPSKEEEKEINDLIQKLSKAK